MIKKGATPSDIIMVANPPGYYLASGNPTIAVPDGDIGTLLAVAKRYSAVYLILEDGSVPAKLMPVYDQPNGQVDLVYMAEMDNARIFLIRHY